MQSVGRCTIGTGGGGRRARCGGGGSETKLLLFVNEQCQRTPAFAVVYPLGCCALQAVADGVFYAELNELLMRELGGEGYSGVEVSWLAIGFSNQVVLACCNLFHSALVIVNE